MRILSKSFEEKWKNYIWQSFGAGLSIILLVAFKDLIGLVLVAAAGSTAFTVFGIPHNRTAKTRNIIGGSIICGLLGLVCSYFSPVWFGGGVAVALSSFFMVLVDAEHPPAAGAALGLAYSSTPGTGFIFVLTTSVIFSLIRYFLKPYLKDLY